MMHVRLIAFLLTFALAAHAAVAQQQPAPKAAKFRVVFDAALQPDPYSGRVYIALARALRPEPRLQMSNWFAPAQMLALDVEALAPGSSVEVSDAPLAFKARYAEIPPGEYWAQAIARRSLDHPSPGDGPGDLYSKPTRIQFSQVSDGVLELKLTEVVKPTPFVDSADIKLVEMRSNLLSDFHKRDYMVRAAVQLPAGWADDAERRWPSLVMIGGFGGTHRDIHRMGRLAADESGALRDCVLIVPDASCGTGHSVFADSANNGPWGRMLTEELLPEVDRQFRTDGPRTRHVSGISSGGWSSLWLVVSYPEQFAACWSHVPDPVDFHDFQRIDLYAPGVNMYKDEAGARRPLARNGGQTMLWYDDFCRMEHVLGRGGQIGSFEAVFSPRGEDGLPRRLYDRETGAVDAATAKSWEPYDIRLVIERGWKGADGAKGLRDELAGKLHVYAGEVDNFFLEGATRRLKDSLEKLGSDAEVRVIEGMGHTFWPEGVQKMRDAIRAANESLQPAAAEK